MAAALSTYSVGGRSSLHSRCVTRRRTTSRRSRSTTRPADELLRRRQVVDRTGISPSQWRRALTCLPVRTLHSPQPDFFTYVHTCMHVILLVSSDSPTLIFFLLRLSAHHLALAVLALQPPNLKLSPSISPYLYQYWYLPSSPQDPLLPPGFPIHLTPSFLPLRFGFCWPLCAFIFTY